MSEQLPIHEPGPVNHREARHQRLEERPADPSRGGSWVTGVILIVLGGIFLMRNTGAFEIPLKNWWALFILIPAVGAFDTALRMFRSAGNRLNAQVTGSLLVGLVLTIITTMFLFEISWTLFGPILIILVGIAILFNSTL